MPKVRPAARGCRRPGAGEPALGQQKPSQPTGMEPRCRIWAPQEVQSGIGIEEGMGIWQSLSATAGVPREGVQDPEPKWQGKPRRPGRWLLVPYVTPTVLHSLWERQGEVARGGRDPQHPAHAGEGTLVALTWHSTAVAMFLHQ